MFVTFCVVKAMALLRWLFFIYNIVNSVPVKVSHWVHGKCMLLGIDSPLLDWWKPIRARLPPSRRMWRKKTEKLDRGWLPASKMLIVLKKMKRNNLGIENIKKKKERISDSAWIMSLKMGMLQSSSMGNNTFFLACKYPVFRFSVIPYWMTI